MALREALAEDGCPVSFLTWPSYTLVLLCPLFLPQTGRSPELFLLSPNRGARGQKMKKSLWAQSEQGGLAGGECRIPDPSAQIPLSSSIILGENVKEGVT